MMKINFLKIWLIWSLLLLLLLLSNFKMVQRLDVVFFHSLPLLLILQTQSITTIFCLWWNNNHDLWRERERERWAYFRLAWNNQTHSLQVLFRIRISSSLYPAGREQLYPPRAKISLFLLLLLLLHWNRTNDLRFQVSFCSEKQRLQIWLWLEWTRRRSHEIRGCNRPQAIHWTWAVMDAWWID